MLMFWFPEQYDTNNNKWKWINLTTHGECVEISHSTSLNAYKPVPTNNEFMIEYNN